MNPLVYAAIAGYLLYQVIVVVLPQYFLVPPHNWKEKILKVLHSEKPIYLVIGTKLSSYRKRLVLASSNPSFYTNFAGNTGKLRLSPEDFENAELFELRFGQREIDDPHRRVLYGFFHPYANNGGGGEKVLWAAVLATLLQSDKNIAVIYTSNLDASPQDILAKVKNKFQIDFDDSKRIVFIYLHKYSRLIDAEYWKHFTMIGQLFGSIVLTFEALNQLSPDVWIDTMGLPGSYLPISIILKIPIIAYTHYPIIQQDMFNKLNTSTPKGALKLVYWKALYYFYKYLGSSVTFVLANGTWTFTHLLGIFTWSSHVSILYPPCGTEYLTVEDDTKRENKMLYIAQFRPEKRHMLILEEYAQFLAKFKGKGQVAQLPTLVFLGSCRTKDDTSTLISIKEKVEELELTEFITFVVDCSYDEVLSWLSRLTFGLNAMWNEHFGIGVVEYMARGVIPISHASAGPLLDIATKVGSVDTGFFFKSETDPDFVQGIQDEEDSDLIFEVKGKVVKYPSLSNLFIELFITNPVSEAVLSEMRDAGVKLATEKFSNKAFMTKWGHYINSAEELEIAYRDTKRLQVTLVF